MKRISWLLSVTVALGVVMAAYAQAPADPAADRYIITLKSGEHPGTVARHHGLAPDFVYDKVLNGFAGAIPPGRLRALQNDPRVAAITPDNVVWAFGKVVASAAQVVPNGVARIGAPVSGVTGADVGVAVVDTGLDFNHADLQPLGAASFSAYKGKSAQDDNGHGTHVGGIIAARNNGIDVVGVAPDATLYAVKVLNSAGSGTDSAVIAGLNWVAANGPALNIRVVNMSLGRAKSSDDSAMHNAVISVVNAGITVVVAAGNDASKDVADMVPAGFAEVIAVASSTAKNGTGNSTYGYIPQDAASFFTTDGAGVTISAPGEDQEDIVTSRRGTSVSSVGILSTRLRGGTTRMSGTSMAAPHVAGVVALLCEQDSSLSPGEAKSKVAAGVLAGTAPLDCKTTKGYTVSGYTFDGVREGIVNAPSALAH